MMAFRLDYESEEWLDSAIHCLQSEGRLIEVPFSELLELVQASEAMGMELYAEQVGDEFTVERILPPSVAPGAA